MQIRNVRQKGLRRFIETGSSAGLPPATAGKIADMIAFLLALRVEDELRTLPIWKPHQLTGDRAGTWAFRVTKNWRVTFLIDRGEIEIFDLNLEDYH